jgi:hypothetical protein
MNPQTSTINPRQLLVTLAATPCIWNGALFGNWLKIVWVVLLALVDELAIAAAIVSPFAVPIMGDGWLCIAVCVYVVAVVLVLPAESVVVYVITTMLG